MEALSKIATVLFITRITANTMMDRGFGSAVLEEHLRVIDGQVKRTSVPPGSREPSRPVAREPGPIGFDFDEFPLLGCE
jgi:hypothetical protein